MIKIPIKIKTFSPDVPIPKYETDLAAGFDLTCQEIVTIAPQETKIVATGIAIAIPENYWLMLVARSSLHKLGLMLINGAGIVDADYCGDNDQIKLLLHNFSTQPVHLEKNLRLAQGILMARHVAEFEKVEKLTNKNRGGIGSTGL